MEKLFGKGLKILVLDDEKDICYFSKEFFEKRGFNVRTALTAQAAMNSAKKIKFDIALLDIYLYKGKKSGIDVLKFIREIRPECRCVMVTRDNNKKAIDEAKKFGASDYLVKPLMLDQLENSVHKIVKKIRKGGK